jgi:hypothetical protein
MAEHLKQELVEKIYELMNALKTLGCRVDTYTLGMNDMVLQQKSEKTATLHIDFTVPETLMNTQMEPPIESSTNPNP